MNFLKKLTLKNVKSKKELPSILIRLEGNRDIMSFLGLDLFPDVEKG